MFSSAPDRDGYEAESGNPSDSFTDVDDDHELRGTVERMFVECSCALGSQLLLDCGAAVGRYAKVLFRPQFGRHMLASSDSGCISDGEVKPIPELCAIAHRVSDKTRGRVDDDESRSASAQEHEVEDAGEVEAGRAKPVTLGELVELFRAEEKKFKLRGASPPSASCPDDVGREIIAEYRYVAEIKATEAVQRHQSRVQKEGKGFDSSFLQYYAMKKGSHWCMMLMERLPTIGLSQYLSHYYAAVQKPVSSGSTHESFREKDAEKNEALRVADAAREALNKLHNLGIVHGDLGVVLPGGSNKADWGKNFGVRDDAHNTVVLFDYSCSRMVDEISVNGQYLPTLAELLRSDESHDLAAGTEAATATSKARGREQMQREIRFRDFHFFPDPFVHILKADSGGTSRDLEKHPAHDDPVSVRKRVDCTMMGQICRHLRATYPPLSSSSRAEAVAGSTSTLIAGSTEAGAAPSGANNAFRPDSQKRTRSGGTGTGGASLAEGGGAVGQNPSRGDPRPSREAAGSRFSDSARDARAREKDASSTRKQGNVNVFEIAAAKYFRGGLGASTGGVVPADSRLNRNEDLPLSVAVARDCPKFEDAAAAVSSVINNEDKETSSSSSSSSATSRRSKHQLKSIQHEMRLPLSGPGRTCATATPSVGSTGAVSTAGIVAGPSASLREDTPASTSSSSKAVFIPASARSASSKAKGASSVDHSKKKHDGTTSGSAPPPDRASLNVEIDVEAVLRDNNVCSVFCEAAIKNFCKDLFELRLANEKQSAAGGGMGFRGDGDHVAKRKKQKARWVVDSGIECARRLGALAVSGQEAADAVLAGLRKLEKELAGICTPELPGGDGELSLLSSQKRARDLLSPEDDDQQVAAAQLEKEMNSLALQGRGIGNALRWLEYVPPVKRWTEEAQDALAEKQQPDEVDEGAARCAALAEALEDMQNGLAALEGRKTYRKNGKPKKRCARKGKGARVVHEDSDAEMKLLVLSDIEERSTEEHQTVGSCDQKARASSRKQQKKRARAEEQVVDVEGGHDEPAAPARPDQSEDGSSPQAAQAEAPASGVVYKQPCTACGVTRLRAHETAGGRVFARLKGAVGKKLSTEDCRGRGFSSIFPPIARHAGKQGGLVCTLCRSVGATESETDFRAEKNALAYGRPSP
eukprot:CAMPEP_0179005498 /NCGR_PEP_ID=MMETSP0795-20121207/13977_1 /TAXON_ID=88552 /ORGANISM="Amoebophrya sp., Strain Ameob2" /LENGTH=1154 /DNA_ID=CAMNT_0020700045 /DNA_START=524 /DNA_END=3989 /DNA_ORIENTATION=-